MEKWNIINFLGEEFMVELLNLIVFGYTGVPEMDTDAITKPSSSVLNFTCARLKR